MSLERDRRKVLKWLRDKCFERNIPYVAALEWWFTHTRPGLGALGDFNVWMEKYHDR